jgi:hypothetical protein
VTGFRTHRIVTHKRMDLDNIVACALLRILAPELFANAEIVLVDANWNGELRDGDFIIDMDAGGRGLKGTKDDDGTTHCCASLILQDFGDDHAREILGSLVEVVDASDVSSDFMRHLVPDVDLDASRALESLSIVSCYRAYKSMAGGNDKMIVDRFAEIIEGMLKIGRQNLKPETNGCEFETFNTLSDDDARNLLGVIERLATDEDSILLMRRLVNYVHVCNDGYECMHNLYSGLDHGTSAILEHTSILAVYLAFKAFTGNDKTKLNRRFGLIIKGMLKNGRERLAAVRLIDEGIQVKLHGDGELAMMLNVRNRLVTTVLRERGVRVAVVVDGMNLMVLRLGADSFRVDTQLVRDLITQVDEKVGDEPDDWFAHPAGFLICKGTKKAPTKTPSAVDPELLVFAALRILAMNPS